MTPEAELEIREKIVVEAKTWLGTPYEHMGKIKHDGVDCAQLLIGIYENIGLLKDINVGDYVHDFHMHSNDELYLSNVLKYCYKVNDPKPGDICLFRYGKCISHAGMIIDFKTIIHSYIRLGVVYDSLSNGQLSSRLEGFYRLNIFKD